MVIAEGSAPAPQKFERKATEFEVGLVYRKHHRYYLAVGERLLVTFKAGEVAEVRPYGYGYATVRTISVEELCAKWGINIDRLDELSAHYLPPSPEAIKTRPRGTRRQREKAQEEWRALRTATLQINGVLS